MGFATNGQLPKDINGLPANGVYVPGVGTTPLQGGTILSDAQGQQYAPGVVSIVGNSASANLDNIVLITSAALTTNTNSTNQTNTNARGVVVFINTGTFGASESTMTVTIQGYDPVSQTYYTILQSASLSASTFSTLTVYPSIAVSANVSANTVLPKTWRVAAAASNWGTGGSTLGVACSMIV